MTYAEKLKDPRWQRKRLEVLERTDFSCEKCGATDKTLHVHHKAYIKGREPWEYDGDQLEALCEDCHRETHRLKDVISRFSAMVSVEDLSRLAGYAVGLFLIDPESILVNLHKVDSNGLAGIADVFGLSYKDIEALIKDDELSGMDIFKFIEDGHKAANGKG